MRPWGCGMSRPGQEPRLDAQVLAARSLARRTLHGELSCRDLVAWAHSAIGHGGARELQNLVELDDAYDEVEFIAPTIEDLNADVVAEARGLLSLRFESGTRMP